MKGIFDPDNKFNNFINKIIELVELNFLWMLLNIPIITIGASTCALYKTASQIACNEEGYIAKTFFITFKNCFKRATKIWLVELLVGVMLLFDFLFWNTQTGNIAITLKTAVIFLAAVYMLCLIYVFPLTVQISCSVKSTVRNSFILAFKYLPKSLLMLLWLILAIVASYIWALCIWLMFLMGFSGIAFLYALTMKKIFRKEISKAETKKM